jgi:hypothetical protein
VEALWAYLDNLPSVDNFRSFSDDMEFLEVPTISPMTQTSETFEKDAREWAISRFMAILDGLDYWQIIGPTVSSAPHQVPEALWQNRTGLRDADTH